MFAAYFFCIGVAALVLFVLAMVFGAWRDAKQWLALWGLSWGTGVLVAFIEFILKVG